MPLLTASRLRSGNVLDKVVEYLQYWYQYRNKQDIPEFDIPVDLCLELLDAADFLGLTGESLLFVCIFFLRFSNACTDQIGIK